MSAATKAGKTAIVFLNMGGPEKSSQVGSFLERLFLDRDLLQLPFQSVLGKYIAKRRTPKIEEQYNEIGGGSPILRWSRIQGEKLVSALNSDSSCKETFGHFISFRYASPLTDECVQQLLDNKVTRAIAFSQYPQYSCSTSGSSFNELYRQLKRLDPQRQIKWSVIDRWPTHELFIKTVAKHVQAKIDEFLKESPENDVVVLFSAHSLPISIVNRGDPYITEVAASCSSVMEQLPGVSWRLAWQSQVGPQPWMGPNTLDAIKGFGRNGRKRVVLVPIAFTSDHIETLYELDLEYIVEAQHCGIQVKRAQSMNDDPDFVAAQTAIIKEHLACLEQPNSLTVSQQFLLKCPNCVNNTCGPMRAYFKSFSKV